MRRAWLISVVVLLAVMLPAPSSSATTSSASTSGVNQIQAATNYWGWVCYMVQTAVGWGDEKCSHQDSGPTAGCTDCELKAIKVTKAFGPAPGHKYQVLVQSGWGDWNYLPAAAGCSTCVIRAMRLEPVDPDQCCLVEYRVRTASGWGGWRSWGAMAGCYTCTVEAIQMREFLTQPI
jgi:hypothetical protein